MASSDWLDVNALAAAIVHGSEGEPRILVGIDGPGGSGKSTLAAALAECLDEARVVHVDDFYLPSKEHGTRAGQVGALFDLPRLADQVVIPAAAGSARYQRYDWDTDTLADWIEIPDRVPVIVEGVYSLHQPLRAAYTYTVFCHADHGTRLARGVARDGEEARATWADEWMPAEDAYLHHEDPAGFAQLVIDSSTASDNNQPLYRIIHWKDPVQRLPSIHA